MRLQRRLRRENSRITSEKDVRGSWFAFADCNKGTVQNWTYLVWAITCVVFRRGSPIRPDSAANPVSVSVTALGPPAIALRFDKWRSSYIHFRRTRYVGRATRKMDTVG